MFREAGSSTKVIVDGRLVTDDFANKIQAGGYAENAIPAVELARN